MTSYLAGCIIRDDDGKILLLHRNTEERVYWEIPGGRCQATESPWQTARRKARDVLSVGVDVGRRIGLTRFDDLGEPMTYVWFEAAIDDGELKIGEPETHDGLEYHSIESMRENFDDLSPNAQDFLTALNRGSIKLLDL